MPKGTLEQDQDANPRPVLVLGWSGSSLALFPFPLPAFSSFRLLVPCSRVPLLPPFSILPGEVLPPSPRGLGAQYVGDEEGGKRKPSLSSFSTPTRIPFLDEVQRYPQCRKLQARSCESQTLLVLTVSRFPSLGPSFLISKVRDSQELSVCSTDT